MYSVGLYPRLYVRASRESPAMYRTRTRMDDDDDDDLRDESASEHTIADDDKEG